ncbi:MAG: hypothetical protein ACHQ1D_01740 [Nitrososphaerales archaeon]
MFIDRVNLSIQGFLKIINKDTKEVLVDTHNDVLYGNMSMAVAHSLIGDSSSFLTYMAFGDGGAYISGPGTVLYKPTLGSTSSIIKNPTANLYNTIYVKKVSNGASGNSNFNAESRAYIPSENYAVSYEDIVVDVTIDFSEPPLALSPVTPNTITFNEIGLFAGTNNLFSGDHTQTPEDVENFIQQTPNFSGSSGSKSKLMLTHVIFDSKTKAATNSIEIIYTLRIQMG